MTQWVNIQLPTLTLCHCITKNDGRLTILYTPWTTPLVTIARNLSAHAHFGLHMLTLVCTCSLWSAHAHFGLHMLTLVSTCSLWSPHAHFGLHMLTLVCTCSLWSAHTHFGLHKLTLVCACSLSSAYAHCSEMILRNFKHFKTSVRCAR